MTNPTDAEVEAVMDAIDRHYDMRCQAKAAIIATRAMDREKATTSATMRDEARGDFNRSAAHKDTGA